MPVNFFVSKCASASTAITFGLCDDQTASPAYISSAEAEHWVAVVENPEQQTIEFYAIDHCLDLYNAAGNMESRCDGLLRQANHQLIFVELKAAKRGPWLADGRKQLANTIKHFRAVHDIKQYKKVTAYICNSARPRESSNQQVAMRMFKDLTGITLRTKNTIWFTSKEA